MKIYGLCAVLCVIIIDVIDICDSKCDEGEINWNELSYPDNSTNVFNEINGYKGCLLEFDCDGKESSCFYKIVTKNLSTHSVIPGYDTIHTYKFLEKPSHVVTEKINTSMYDVNIIYVNEYDMRNDSKTQNYIIFCDYAETVCIDDESPQNHSLNDYKNSINFTNHDERTLQIIFNRDQTSPIQPVFTGYYSPFSNDSNFSTYSVSDVPLFDEFKSVAFHCKFRGDQNNCERSNDNSSIEDANKTPSINVYLKTNYVQNDTKTKYSNCTKPLDNTDSKSFNFECDGTGFSEQNPHILFTPKVNYNSSINYSHQSNASIIRTEINDLLIWYCQVMDLNYTGNTTLLIGQPQYNGIYLKNCSSSKKLSNSFQSRDTQDIPENKVEILDDINTNDDNGNNNIEMHIVTEARNNCSQNLSLSLIEGKIIDLEKDINKDNILKYDMLELKLSNCIDNKYIIRNNTQLYHQIEFDIIFNNDTTNNTFKKILKRKNEEPNDKRHIILHCLNPGLSTENNTKVTLECEFIDTIISNTSNNTSEENIKNITITRNNTSEKNIKKEKVNIDFGVTNKNNCTTNETEHSNTRVPRKCSSNELIECNNNFTSTENNSKIIEEEGSHNNNKYKSKIQTVTKTTANTEISRQHSLDLGSDDDFEKIMLIVILTIAGTSIMAVMVLRICPNKKQYHPTPTREEPNEEDTAL